MSGLQLTYCFLIEGLLDNVTVLIGIAYGGKAIAGVINQPFYNYQVHSELKDVVFLKHVTLVHSNSPLVSSDQEQI